MWHSHSPAWSMGPLVLQFTFHSASPPPCPCSGSFAWHKALMQVQVCGNPAGRPLSAVTNCSALPLLLHCLQIQPKAAAVQSSALLFQAGSLSSISRAASITLMGSRLQNSPLLVKKAGAGVKMGLNIPLTLVGDCF